MSTVTKTSSPKLTPAECAAIYAEAVAAGRAAANALTPVPMLVGEPITPLGNQIDYTRPVHYISDGACGFAWVIVKPGNSRFARWLVQHGHARKDTYYGGVNIWVHEYNQSMQKKEAHARAIVKVLHQYGIYAHSGSRMD